MGESCDGEAVGCGEDLCQIIVQAGELSLDPLIAETGWMIFRGGGYQMENKFSEGKKN